MVDEHDESQDESQEEGEYHFSDDQANYDMDIDGTVKDAAVAAAPKESVTDKLKQHRRIVIGVVVFIVLLGIVYKFVSPSATTVPDFQATTASSSSVATTKKEPAVAPAAPVAAMKAEPQQAAIAPAQAPVATPQTVTTITTPAAPVVETNVDKSVLDRIATLEQQNSAMMNLLQTQYAQKIADTETQNSQLRTQVQELNSRISNMEIAFRQLTKMLSNGRSSQAMVSNQNGMNNLPAPSRVTQPKSTYTVQAIIPGRAWLKADSGDTVTVAEGDVLKDLGRITKIDPYDGIVDIDTGSKIVSLSYGASGD